MHRKDYNNNIISTQQREINEVGINNNGYSEYLNTITSTGQKDSSNEDHFKKQLESMVIEDQTMMLLSCIMQDMEF